MKKIMVIEDEQVIREELLTLLKRNGYDAVAPENFVDVSGAVLDVMPDMVLLDINLPGVDGESVLRDIRKKSQLPVIMVTSRDTEMDEVLCMSFGADDFVAKPYNPSILLLHIEAVLKRYDGRNENSEIVYNNVRLDVAKGIISTDKTSLRLTKNELGILSFMIKNSGRIVPRDELINYLWDSEEFVDDNTLTVNINRVRRKLEELGGDIRLVTRRGQGYVLEALDNA
jgi:DNA-binding response OmpR family regulator